MSFSINRLTNRLQIFKKESNKSNLDPAAEKTVKMESVIDSRIQPNGKEKETFFERSKLSTQETWEKTFIQSLTQMVTFIKHSMVSKKNLEITNVNPFIDSNLPKELQDLIKLKKFYEEASIQANPKSTSELQALLTTLKGELWTEKHQFHLLKTSMFDNNENTSSLHTIREGMERIRKLNTTIDGTQELIARKVILDNKIQEVNEQIKNFNPELNELNKKAQIKINKLKMINEKINQLESDLIKLKQEKYQLENNAQEIISNSSSLVKMHDINILSNELKELRAKKKNMKAQLKEIYSSIKKLGYLPSFDKPNQWIADLLEAPLEGQIQKSTNRENTLPSRSIVDRYIELTTKIKEFENNPEYILPEFQEALQTYNLQKKEFSESIETANKHLGDLKLKILLSNSKELIDEKTQLIEAISNDSDTLFDINLDIENIKAKSEEAYHSAKEEKSQLEKTLHENHEDALLALLALSEIKTSKKSDLDNPPEKPLPQTKLT